MARDLGCSMPGLLCYHGAALRIYFCFQFPNFDSLAWRPRPQQLPALPLEQGFNKGRGRQQRAKAPEHHGNYAQLQEGEIPLSPWWGWEQGRESRCGDPLPDAHPPAHTPRRSVF